jgi:3-hydroxyacyl-CoA dehydrogenase/enoyl-CoA hydratase/3-hydroxybutyryl-CoA epimerase
MSKKPPRANGNGRIAIVAGLRTPFAKQATAFTEKAAQIMRGAFGERLDPPPIFAKIREDGRAGRKNGKGFYRYEKGKKVKRRGRDVVDASVYKLLEIKPTRRADPEDLGRRVALQMVGEAIRCLEEGILRSPRDGDIGAVFGLGFPPFRGGPFRYADAVGPQALLEMFRAEEQRFGLRWAPPKLLVDRARSGRPFHGASADPPRRRTAAGSARAEAKP